MILTEKEIAQIFENNFDGWITFEDELEEPHLEMGMTRDKFVEVISGLQKTYKEKVMANNERQK